MEQHGRAGGAAALGRRALLLGVGILASVAVSGAGRAVAAASDAAKAEGEVVIATLSGARTSGETDRELIAAVLGHGDGVDAHDSHVATVGVADTLPAWTTSPI